MAHTPGPWKVVDRFYVWTDDDVGCEVARVCDENLDDDMLWQADADARLIASAPELLAALKQAVSLLSYASQDGGIYGCNADEWFGMEKSCRAAIATAEGRDE